MSDDDDEWISLKEYLRRTEPLERFFWEVFTYYNTRRTVTVATRKYRARRRRR